jgi:hemerythrin-like metal-binding protein
MQNDDLLEWGPSLVTGVEAIDEQHKMLVDMLNEANLRMRSHIDRSVTEDIVRDLMSYALYHFETEEELMLDHGYSQGSPEDASKHLSEHRDFSRTVGSVQQDLIAGKPITREALLGFLNNWLVNHIMHTDKRLAAFLKGSQGGSA